MSPVTLAELDPLTRQRALQQIGETEGTTALAIIEDNNHSSTYTPAEMRARSIVSRMASQDAFDASMAITQSIKLVNAQIISPGVRKMAPALVASLVSVTKLKAHPLSVRVYGEPTGSVELLRSIKEIGVVQPIVVDDDGFILAGTSRHYAAVQAGHTEIPAVIFKGSALEREWLVLESNRQRVKLASQLGREYIERLRLESEFAKLRMVEGGKNKGMPQVAEAAGAARDKAAAAVNLGRTTAERLAKIVIKADNGQPKARRVLEDVDTGVLSIAAAFNELEPRRPEAKPADCPVCAEHFSSMTDLKRHARNTHGLEATALREAMGFENTEKDPRHNQKSPYAERSAFKKAIDAAHFSQNALGLTEALETIHHLNDIAMVDKRVLRGLQTVMSYVTGNTTNGTGQHVTDGSGVLHFRSPQEWDVVDKLIASLAKVGNLLAAKGTELRTARNKYRKKFLDSNVLPTCCPTGKRIYASAEDVSGDPKGVLRTTRCKQCGGIHIDSEAS